MMARAGTTAERNFQARWQDGHRAEPAVRAIQLSKVIDGQLILDQIDLSIARGELLALLGDNAAGKTTLLRCLAGAIRPTAGQIRWFGRRAWGNTAARRLVGMVAHESFLYPELTARENLRFAARMFGAAQPARRVQRLLAESGLDRFARRPVGKLSRGVRQRLSILRALVHQPPILLLDEPFSSLDGEGTAWLASLLEQLRAAGRAICFATHRQPMCRRLAARVVRLRAGRLAAELQPRTGHVAGPSDWKRSA